MIFNSPIDIKHRNCELYQGICKDVCFRQIYTFIRLLKCRLHIPQFHGSSCIITKTHEQDVMIFKVKALPMLLKKKVGKN